jgi:hypothetical protein
MLSIVGLIPTILTFLTGISGTVGKVSDNIKELEIKREQTKSDEKLKQIDAEILALHDKKDVLVAEAGSRVNAIFRVILALPAFFILWKLMVHDKVIGSIVGCSGPAARGLEGCGKYLTDPLDTNQWWVIGAVIGFYFLTTWRTK